MANLPVNRAEIMIIMKALNSLDHLTEDESAVRAMLAYKLGAASADIMMEARTTSPAPIP